MSTAMRKPKAIRNRVSGTVVEEIKLPHERDEAVGMTGGVVTEPMKQAYRDLQRGLEDTDRGAVAGRTYRKLKK